MKEITQEYLKELFDYKDRILYWKNVNRNRFVKNGDIAGILTNTGYYQIIINGKAYRTHRLIFLYHHSYLPEFIDYIDRNKSNNNIKNLRPITKIQNSQNQKLIKNKSSIYKGINWHKATQK